MRVCELTSRCVPQLLYEFISIASFGVVGLYRGADNDDDAKYDKDSHIPHSVNTIIPCLVLLYSRHITFFDVFHPYLVFLITQSVTHTHTNLHAHTIQRIHRASTRLRKRWDRSEPPTLVGTSRHIETLDLQETNRNTKYNDTMRAVLRRNAFGGTACQPNEIDTQRWVCQTNRYRPCMSLTLVHNDEATNNATKSRATANNSRCFQHNWSTHLSVRLLSWIDPFVVVDTFIMDQHSLLFVVKRSI